MSDEQARRLRDAASNAQTAKNQASTALDSAKNIVDQDLTNLNTVELRLQNDVSSLVSAQSAATLADNAFTDYLTNTIGSSSYNHTAPNATFGAGPTCKQSTGRHEDAHGVPTTDCWAITKALSANNGAGAATAEGILATHILNLDNTHPQGLWQLKNIADGSLTTIENAIGSTGPFHAAGPFGSGQSQIGPYANGACPTGIGYTHDTDCYSVQRLTTQFNTDLAAQTTAQTTYDTAVAHYGTARTALDAYTSRAASLISLAVSLPKALSPTNPAQWPEEYIDPRSGLAGYAAEAGVTRVDNKSDDLAHIFTYAYADTADSSSFIIVDPSQYYNLTSYQQASSGGANIPVSQYPYNAIQQSQGTVTSVSTPPGNCPVLGLSEYDGICDPTPDTTVDGVTKATWAGCNVPIYSVGGTTSFTTSAGTVNAANYPVVWSGYVRDWKVIDVATYTTETSWRVGVGGQPIYATPTTILPRLGTNPIIKLTRAMAYCNMEEMSQNPVELPAPKLDIPSASNPACIQYIQFQGNGFVDLYNPATYQDPANNAAAYVTKQDYYKDALGTLHQVLNGAGQPVGFFDTTTTYTDFNQPAKPAVVATAHASLPQNTSNTPSPGIGMGVANGHGSGIHLAHGTSVAIQLEQQTVSWTNNIPNGWDQHTGAATSWATGPLNCIELSNGPTGTDVFVPTNKTTELQSFITAVAAGLVGGTTPTSKVTVSMCHDIVKSYAATGNGTSTWNGTLSCLGINPSCNQVQKIAAQRYCLRPTGSLGVSTECAYQVDPTITSAFVDPDAGHMINPLTGNSYMAGDTVNKMVVQNVTPFYFEATCVSTNSCPGTPTGGHVFCLAPETKITMADGSEKAITDLKSGDEVKAFDGKHSRGLLKTAKVKATTKTEKQPLVEIDGLKITPFHKVVLANGRAVNAEDIKVGDTILKGDGMYEKVKTVKKGLKPITVYNLVLEDADGYIANGKRVLDYPAPDDVVR